MSKTLKYLIYISICILAFACQQMPEDEWTSDEANRTLKVKVRSAGEAEIAYPLYLYAFNSKGGLTAQQTIADAEGDMSLPLSKGDFQVVALSGVSDEYELPEQPGLEDVITLSGTSGASTPLMAGRADVEIGDTDEASAQITLSYVVAALNVKLKDVPDNVSEVQLSLSPLHSSLSMGGTFGGDAQKVKVNCSLTSEGVWEAETSYIFPGNGKKTVFSIYFKTEDGTEVTYGYTFEGIPEANHLFNVVGTYAGGVIVGGNFDVTDWEGAIDVEFEFGANMVPDEDENDGNDEETKEDDEQPDIDLTGVPETGTIWNDMIVVDMMEADDTGVDLLLMTLDEWEATTSQVEDVMEGYSINGLSDWRLPTHDEAAVLRARFSGDYRLDLNDLIADYDPSFYGLDGDERYLCTKNGIYYSFKFAGGTSTTKAGDKRSYYVRLVKTYRFALQEN